MSQALNCLTTKIIAMDDNGHARLSKIGLPSYVSFKPLLEMELKHILVPIDFSKASLDAASYAVSLARPFDASVMLLNVVPPPVIVEDSFLAFAMTTQAEIVEKSHQQIKKETRRIGKIYPDKTEGWVIEGVIQDSIIRFAKKEGSDLIVVGRKGKGKSNSIFGSVATGMIKKSSVPVLIVPEKGIFTSIRFATFASDMITALDDQKASLLKDIFHKFGTKINLLHIQKEKETKSSIKQTAKNILGPALSKMDYDFHIITDTNIEKGIQEFISEHPTDLLVMISHPHNILQRMLGRTLTKNMSYQTNIPLLALPLNLQGF